MENGSNAAVDGFFNAFFSFVVTRAVFCLFCKTKAAPPQLSPSLLCHKHRQGRNIVPACCNPSRLERAAHCMGKQLGHLSRYLSSVETCKKNGQHYSMEYLPSCYSKKVYQECKHVIPLWKKCLMLGWQPFLWKSRAALLRLQVAWPEDVCGLMMHLMCTDVAEISLRPCSAVEGDGFLSHCMVLVLLEGTGNGRCGAQG